MNSKIKAEIMNAISNQYAETHVGHHAEYRNWNGEFERGCYAQIAAPHGGTRRIYAHSYAALLELVTLDVALAAA